MIMPGTAIEGGGGSRGSSEFEFISKVTHFLKMLVLRTPPPFSVLTKNVYNLKRIDSNYD